jgi:hypothetical protein
MAGILRTDTIQNSNTSTIITQTNSTTITIGTTGQTVALASGATSSGFGATYNGAINWDTTPKTTTVTAASGVGYFVNTTSGAVTVNLPAGVAGSIVAVSDYANIAATNNIIITPNGTDKIDGVNGSYYLVTNGAAITLIYVDSTRGWKDVNDATLNAVGVLPFVAATGGTITTSGDFKIHTFTGPGTFTVTNAGSPAGSSTVDYLVVAGGGGGGGGSPTGPSSGGGAGGGAGGFRQSFPNPATAGFPITTTAYPITVGGGGTGGTLPGGLGGSGSNSVFSTITSAGGGGGAMRNIPGTAVAGASGGSGGGASHWDFNGTQAGGTGNTPPVSPSQGNPGGSVTAAGGNRSGGGGGGANAAGSNAPDSILGGNGGAGSPTSISGSAVTYAGGGGGTTGGTGGAGGGGNGADNPGVSGSGTTNTGGGGGGNKGGPACGQPGGAGGSGIVIVRYKYQ